MTSPFKETPLSNKCLLSLYNVKFVSVPLSNKHPLSNRRPHDNFSTNIPANNKKEHIKASCSMSNSNDNTMTLNEDSDNEVEI